LLRPDSDIPQFMRPLMVTRFPVYAFGTSHLPRVAINSKIQVVVHTFSAETVG